MLSEVRDAVSWALDHGLTPMPLKPGTKVPRLEKWPELPREKLLEAFRPGDNVGIRIERPFFVIDVDHRALLEVVRRFIPEADSTLTTVTKDGFHLYFRARGRYPPNHKKSRLVQLLAEGSQVVMPPSVVEGHNYRFTNPDAPILDLDDEKVANLLKFLDIIAKHETWITKFAEVWTEGARHNISLYLAGALRQAGIDREEALVAIATVCALAGDREWDDRKRAVIDTFAKPEGEYAGIGHLREVLRVVVPDRAEELLNSLPRPSTKGAVVSEGGTTTEKRENVRKILSHVLPGAALEAIGVDDGMGGVRPALLVYSGGKFEITPSFEFNGTTFVPRDPRSYPYTPYMVRDLAARGRIELIDAVHAEVRKFIDAEPREHALFTAFILLSYAQEKFDSVPYLFLVGDNQSGKSHALRLFSELCYRPLWGVSLTAADLYSYLEDDGPPMTIIEDEFQGSEKDTEKMKIYKAGYKRGARVPRVTMLEGGRRVDYFNAFGVKLMAGESVPENKGFLERCIIVEMIEGYPEKDHYDDADLDRFAVLRAELLKWRMRVLAGDEALPSVEGLDWLRGRDRELYLPLLTVLEGHPLGRVLMDYLREKVEQKKLERESSLEAIVARAAAEILQSSPEIEFGALWGKIIIETGVDDGVRGDAIETEAFGRVTKKRVANILQNLGLRKRKEKRQGKMTTLYKPHGDKFARALRKYGIKIARDISESDASDASDSWRVGALERTVFSPPEPEKTGFAGGYPLQESDPSDPSDSALPGGPDLEGPLPQSVRSVRRDQIITENENIEPAPLPGQGPFPLEATPEMPSETLDIFKSPETGPSPEPEPGVIELGPEDAPEYQQLPEDVRPFLAKVLIYGQWRDLECRCGCRFVFMDFAHHVRFGWCEARERKGRRDAVVLLLPRL